MIELLVGALIGAAGWSLSEYVLHRWLMHEMRGRGYASSEHLRHHAEVEWDPSTWPNPFAVPGSVAIVVVSLIVGTLLVGFLGGAGFAIGFVGSYWGYEIIHRRCHYVAPRGVYSRWVRKHHFLHHFRSPRKNHGVTLPVWDIVFRTSTTSERVRVPRRHAMAWLVDDAGELRTEFAADYELVGARADRDTFVARDHEAAFANEAPPVPARSG